MILHRLVGHLQHRVCQGTLRLVPIRDLCGINRSRPMNANEGSG